MQPAAPLVLANQQAEQASRLREWTTGMWTYDKVLSGLKEVSAKPSPAPEEDSSSSDDSSSESSSSESEDDKKQAKGKKCTAAKAAGGAKAKAAAQGGKKAKAAASSSSSSSSESDSSSSESDSEASSSGNESDSDSDPAPQGTPTPSAAAMRARGATHVGRYQKRERAKMVRGYSASDLAAILGAAPAAAAGVESRKEIAAGKAPTPSPSPSASPASSEAPSSSSSESGSESSSDTEEGAAAQKSKGGKEVSAKSRLKKAARVVAEEYEVVRDDEPGEGQAAGEKPWWVGLFIRAGRMGSIKSELKSKKTSKEAHGKGEEDDKKIRISGFREQDQEQLYEQVGAPLPLLALHAFDGCFGCHGAPRGIALTRGHGRVLLPHLPGHQTTPLCAPLNPPQPPCAWVSPLNPAGAARRGAR